MTDVAAAVPANETPGVNLSNRQKLEILGAILLALFLFALDQTVVGTALPIIVTDLHGNALYTWAVTIYLLTVDDQRPDLRQAVGPVRPAPDLHLGGRPVPGRVGAVPASARRCGSSSSFRGLQGLGGGAVFPIALAVVADLYTPAERGKYLGLFGAVFGLSSLLGPGHRRVHHRHVRLALDLLRQHPDRPGLAVRLLAAAAADQATRGRPEHRLPRRRGLFTAAIAPFLIGLTNKQTRRVDRSRGSAG